ncbi:transcriptional regulator, IclR family [Yoonia tamlensis]|uniref:Transcriptional regulator, IclR family n=1 Tax=Yoonia tamlensis TaxID=390270 RepID=A0A1I6GNP3_9RHOB|nr:IclR family transcriptional regulator [Yoonia tamlensis]SFR43845.1 transcriptional regulator, IclR family [Yoonia tamlensis]
MGVVTGDGTVGKALTVLDQVAGIGRPVRMRELLETSEFPKPTLHRLLQTLTNQGMLTYDPDAQTYAPGIRLVRMAHIAWSQASLAPIARPHIDALAANLREAVHVAQIDNGQVVFVDKRQASTKFSTLAQAGQVAPAYCTGVGKAILAFLPKPELKQALQLQAFHRYTPATHTNAETLKAELATIRKDGIAYDREEHAQGIISIAAPILTPANRVVGAMSIATATNRHSLDGLEAFRPALVECAQKIGAEAQSWQPPSLP